MNKQRSYCRDPLQKLKPEQVIQAPDGVRKIVGALVSRALSQAAQEGFTDEQFYQAMMAEKQLGPHGLLTALLEKTLQRLRECR